MVAGFPLVGERVKYKTIRTQSLFRDIVNTVIILVTPDSVLKISIPLGTLKSITSLKSISFSFAFLPLSDLRPVTLTTSSRKEKISTGLQ